MALNGQSDGTRECPLLDQSRQSRASGRHPNSRSLKWFLEQYVKLHVVAKTGTNAANGPRG